MNKNFAEKFPGAFQRIGTVADNLGVELYVVGGYVRDLILNNSDKKDIDFSVVGNALDFAHELILRCNAKNLVVYERFGTAMLEFDEFKFEFVTAREENYLEDSRKPIVKTANLQSDLSRRDFTINTLAIGLNKNNWGQLFDPFDGIRDLKKKVLRTPLDPKMTFCDDPLRILRAVRFATTLNFIIHQSTKEAIGEMAPRLEIISKERISDELFKMMASKQPSRGFILMDELNILPYVMPEMVFMKGVEQRNDFHHKDVFFHTLKVLDNVAKVTDKLPLRLTALLHDVAKPKTKQFDEQVGWTFHGHDEIGARMMEGIARRLCISKEVKKYIQNLIRLHLRPIFLATEEVTDSAIRRLVVQAGDDLPDLITLCRADITSGNPERVRKHLKNFDFVMKRVQDVREKDELQKFQSPVRGDKIMEVCDLSPGPMVGKIKHAIEEAILEGEIPNNYDAALEYLFKIKDQFMIES